MCNRVVRTAILAISLTLLPGLGCSSNPGGLSTAREKQAQQLDEIAKRTGGDWNKLTDKDKDFLVKDLSGGNEGNAKLLLGSKAGHRPGPPMIPGRPPANR